jgi:hypothetical protein
MIEKVRKTLKWVVLTPFIIAIILIMWPVAFSWWLLQDEDMTMATIVGFLLTFLWWLVAMGIHSTTVL